MAILSVIRTHDKIHIADYSSL